MTQATQGSAATDGTQQARPHRRVVAFLGMGNTKKDAKFPYYDAVRYKLDGRATAEPVPLVQQALVELLDLAEDDELVLLGTSKVRDRWIEKRHDTETEQPDTGRAWWVESGDAHKLLKRRFLFVEVPEGAEGKQLRTIFAWLLYVFDPAHFEAPGEAPGLQHVEPDRLELYLDVTHGFRIQPIYGVQALHFAVAEWERRGQTVPPIRILYGAYDAANKAEPAPIWDLTETLTASRWNRAVDAMLRYGRGDALASLAAEEYRRRTQRTAGVDYRRESKLRQLGDRVRQFSNDIVTGRLEHLLTESAGALYEVLKDEQLKDLLDRFPYLQAPMAALREQVRNLQADQATSRSGIEAALRLATLLHQMNRYLERAAVLRETFVTWLQVQLQQESLPDGLAGALEEAATSEDDAAHPADTSRQQADKLFQLLAARSQRLKHSSTEWERLADEIAKTRNDMLHQGFNKDRRSAKKLIDKLDKLQPRLEELLLAESPAREGDG